MWGGLQDHILPSASKLDFRGKASFLFKQTKKQTNKNPKKPQTDEQKKTSNKILIYFKINLYYSSFLS